MSINHSENYSSIEEALKSLGQVVVSTSGNSMYPMLRHRRDMIIVKQVTKPLKRGDVPIYRLKSGKVVAHRILKVTDKGYIIRGDNLLCKEFVTNDMIIGVLDGFNRGGKYYNCRTSKKYKLYVWWILNTFFLRYLWIKAVRPSLLFIKHKILKIK